MEERPALAVDPEAALLPTPVPGGPLVGVLVATRGDLPLMEKAGTVLKEAEVEYEIRVLSAHRDPDGVREYCRTARARGIRVLIAGAGLAAGLPGIAAAHTDLPVIGVPLSSPTSAGGGVDAILSMVQMPTGVPVATVGLDNPKNAAHLAVRILGAT